MLRRLEPQRIGRLGETVRCTVERKEWRSTTFGRRIQGVAKHCFARDPYPLRLLGPVS